MNHVLHQMLLDAVVSKQYVHMSSNLKSHVRQAMKGSMYPPEVLGSHVCPETQPHTGVV